MTSIEALTLDFQSTQDFISKCDDHMFKIKNWALLTASAVIAYSISGDKEIVVFANLALVFAFLYLELIYKSFQDTAIDHSIDISKRIDFAMGAAAEAPAEEDYQFGFGRKLQYPSVSQCWGVLKNSKRRHIANFYGLIILFSVGAFFLGRYY